MHLALPFLLAVFCPQDGSRPVKRPGGLVLPPVKTSAPQHPAARRKVNDPQQFLQDVVDLRKSKRLSDNGVALILQQLKQDYDAPQQMALNAVRKAKPDMVHGLMHVLRHFGQPADGQELYFLLQTKAMGSATQEVMDTMVHLLGVRAKERLLDCLSCKYGTARKAAMQYLLDRVSKEDLPQVLLLSKERKKDVCRQAIRLLARLDATESTARLLQLLANQRGLAREACLALVEHGPKIVPELHAVLDKPVRGRQFAYATFALLQLAAQQGKSYIPAKAVPKFRKELLGPDPFTRVVMATALSELAYQSSPDLDGGQALDQCIVDGLMLVVAPKEFINDLNLLQGPALAALVRFTGEDFRNQGHLWQQWWTDARAGFVGTRAAIVLDAENAQMALLTWTDSKGSLSFRGATVSVDAVPKGTTQYILSGAAMQTLVQDLMKLGFMSGTHSQAAVLTSGTLDLVVGDRRSRLRLPDQHAALARALREQLWKWEQAQLWQSYRDPEQEPDAVVFWRQHAKAFADAASDRDQWLRQRIVNRLGSMSQVRQSQALEHLLGLADLPQQLTEAEAFELVRVARQQPSLDEHGFRMLEIAMLPESDQVWRRALEVLDRQDAVQTGQWAARLFGLLGAERVLLSLQHPNPQVRLAAIHELARSRDLRAVPKLLPLVRSDDVNLQSTAVYALGIMRAREALPTLLALEADATSEVRRQIWLALGKIGGPDALPILQKALFMPGATDQRYAIRALGELRNANAVRLLAARFCLESRTEADELQIEEVRLALRKQGALQVPPALHEHLTKIPQGPMRARLVGLLAEFQDPIVVPDLIAMLNSTKQQIAVLALSEITGLDLALKNQRWEAMTQWYQVHRQQSQSQWYLQALAREGLQSPLRSADLAPGVGVEAVRELTRILVTAEKPHIRVLTGVMLRETTGAEFGSINRYAERQALESIAERYRYHAAAVRAASAEK